MSEQSSPPIGFAKFGVANITGGAWVTPLVNIDVELPTHSHQWTKIKNLFHHRYTVDTTIAFYNIASIDGQSLANTVAGIEFLVDEFLSQLGAPPAPTGVANTRPAGRYDKFYASIKATTKLEKGWDSYDAPVPNSTARANAVDVLDRLFTRAIEPARILPSADGGIGLCFTGVGKRYADIECFNSGEILAVTSNRIDDPVVWTVGTEASIDDTIDRILTFLAS